MMVRVKALLNATISELRRVVNEIEDAELADQQTIEGVSTLPPDDPASSAQARVQPNVTDEVPARTTVEPSKRSSASDDDRGKR